MADVMSHPPDEPDDVILAGMIVFCLILFTFLKFLHSIIYAQ